MNTLTKSEINWNKMQEIINLAEKFLPVEEIKNAQNFLDRNEIGISFSELCGAICEGNLAISKDLKMKLVTLYNDLDGDSEDFWQEIKLKEHILNMKTDEI